MRKFPSVVLRERSPRSKEEFGLGGGRGGYQSGDFHAGVASRKETCGAV